MEAETIQAPVESLRKSHLSISLAGLVLGLAWWAFAWSQSSVLESPWRSSFALGAPYLAIPFSLAGVLTTLALRVRLRRAPLDLLARCSLAAPLLGALSVSAIHVLLIYASGDFVEEIRMEPTLPGKLFWTGLCVLAGAWKGLQSVIRAGLWSAALTFVSILALYWTLSRSRPLHA